MHLRRHILDRFALQAGIIALSSLFVVSAVSAQQPGPNRKVLTGIADPSDPDARIETDLTLQRQNGSRCGASRHLQGQFEKAEPRYKRSLEKLPRS